MPFVKAKTRRRRERYAAWKRGEAPAGARVHFCIYGIAPGKSSGRRLGRIICASMADAKVWALRMFRWHLERGWRLLAYERDDPGAAAKVERFRTSPPPRPVRPASGSPGRK